MRVRAQHPIKITELKLFAEDINRVGAVQAKRRLFQQPVLQLLQPDRGRELARLPQDSHHFAVGSQTLGARARTDLAHG